jgi:hypothetical protein
VSPHLAQNPQAELARHRKAIRLAEALLAQNVTAELVEGISWTDPFWTKVAENATVREGSKVHPPHSKATVDEVIAELRRRSDDSDPFAFPPTPADRIATP